METQKSIRQSRQDKKINKRTISAYTMKEKNRILDAEFLRKNNLHILGMNVNLYGLDYKGKKYLVVREGFCDPKKCNSACCKLVCFNDNEKKKSYWKNFFDEGKFAFILKRKCKMLKRNGLCKLWGKNLPGACQQFPHPEDAVYLENSDKCSFQFRLIGEWFETKKTLKNVRRKKR